MTAPSEALALLERMARGTDGGPGGSGYPICRYCGRMWFDKDPEPDGGHSAACFVDQFRALLAAPVADPSCPHCGHPTSDHGEHGCKWGCAWGLCDGSGVGERGAVGPASVSVRVRSGADGGPFVYLPRSQFEAGQFVTVRVVKAGGGT